MHAESLALVRGLVAHYAKLRGARVVDLGSYDVNGSYRDLVLGPGAFFVDSTYTGFDQRPGPNVDETSWDRLLSSDLFDVVLCGQMLEHDPRPARTMMRVRFLLAIGGVAIVVAPFRWPVHREPVDLWRFTEQGLEQLCEEAALRVLKSGIVEHDAARADSFVVAVRA